MLHRWTRVLLMLGLAWVMASPVRASSMQPLPAEVVQALPGATAAGQQRFRVWGFEVYDARLWTAPGFAGDRYEASALALELAYLRDFKGQAIAERSLKEMRRVGNISDAQAQRWLGEMQRVFPDVKRGERLLGVHRPGEGAFFWLNGRPAGEIRDAEFSRLFFGIWLSSRTSEPALRQVLLGNAP